MNAYSLLLIESLMSIALSLAVLFVLSRPLIGVLTRICPDEQAAKFWQSYAKVMLVITPLLGVLIVSMFGHFNDPLDNVRLALVAAFGGMLIGLRSIGLRLSQFIETARTERNSA